MTVKSKSCIAGSNMPSRGQENKRRDVYNSVTMSRVRQKGKN